MSNRVPGHTCHPGFCRVKDCPGNPESYILVYKPSWERDKDKE